MRWYALHVAPFLMKDKCSAAVMCAQSVVIENLQHAVFWQRELLPCIMMLVNIQQAC